MTEPNFVNVLATGNSDNLTLPRDMRYAKRCLVSYGVELVLAAGPAIDPARYPVDPRDPKSGGKRRRPKHGRLTTIEPSTRADPLLTKLADEHAPPTVPKPPGRYVYTEPGRRKLHDMLAEAVRNTKKGSDDENR